MLWDGNRQIQEFKNNLVFTTVYEQDSFIPVARLVSDKNELKVYHYHTDHLGTPNELTDSKGNVIWLVDYNAWGSISEICEDFKYQKQTINGIVIDEIDLQPIRFQGQFFDKETGLHYNRFRYYDNDVGMFVSRDPIGLNGGFNVFAYAPNPTEWIDPWGLSCTKGDVKRFNDRNSITSRWVKILSNKKPEDVRNYLIKRGWIETHPQALNPQATQHTVFVKTTKKGKTYGLDYNPSTAPNSTHKVPYWKVKIIKNNNYANGDAIGRIGQKGFDKYNRIIDSPVYIDGKLMNQP